MDFELTEEQQLIRDMAARLARDLIAPRAAAMDEAGEIAPEVLKGLRELNFFGLTTPPDYGGAGCDSVSSCLALEEISRASAAVGIMLSVQNSLVGPSILHFGTEEQKRRYLPELAAGRIGAFAQTEPGAGSDAGALQASARREGEEYVLNGTKVFVTNGHLGDLFIILAKTDPAAGHHGITAFLVEKGTPGLEVGKPEKKLGLRASDTVELALTDCRVPAGNRLGDEGMGFKIGMTGLDAGRLGVGAQAVGIGQAALDEAVRYASERIAFGKPLADLQAIQWMLADMETQLAAARLMVLHGAWLKDRGKPFTAAAARAKLFATEASHGITYRAVQIHGGYGYMADYPVERYYRDARVTEVYEGTSEIQRLVIARELLRSAPSGKS